jgi:hypothetical protein
VADSGIETLVTGMSLILNAEGSEETEETEGVTRVQANH